MVEIEAVRNSRIGVMAMGVLVGLILAPPAPALRFGPDDSPITKWFPGERKPAPSTPTAATPTVPGTTVPGTMPPFPLPGGRPTSPPLAARRSAEAVASTVKVRSWIEPDKRRIRRSRRIDFYVEVAWIGEPGDVLPEPEEPVLINLEKAMPMSQVSRLVPGTEPKTIVVTFHYVLEPTETGAASIEPIAIPCRLRGSTDALRLTTDRFALEILPRPWPWGKIALGAAIAVVLAGGGVATVRVLIARARRAREAARVPPAPSPFERLRTELDQVRRQFREGAAKDGFGAVEQIVRRALGERLGADFRYVTIDELSQRLDHESLDTALRDRAAAILDRCSRVKFAGYVPTVADQDQIVADCRLLLDDFEAAPETTEGLEEGNEAKA